MFLSGSPAVTVLASIKKSHGRRRFLYAALLLCSFRRADRAVSAAPSPSADRVRFFFPLGLHILAT